jgi:hypothetical protein
MFVAFMPLHILLCDEVLLYFILHIGVVQSLNLNFARSYSISCCMTSVLLVVAFLLAICSCINCTHSFLL